MLSQVKKLTDSKGRKELAGRFGAWWDGKDYVPAEDDAIEGEDGAEGEPVAKAGEAPAEISEPDTEADGARIAALERMWGVGQFGPGATDAKVLDALGAEPMIEGDIGIMGGDPAMLRAWSKRSDRNLFASEWRAAALERVRKAVPDISVIEDDVDRLKAFPDDALAALASVNTMAFADHKAGLVSCAFQALSDGGRWVVLDTVRTTPGTPLAGFASAWAEPQLIEEEEFDHLLEKANFGAIEKTNLTELVVQDVRHKLAELGAGLEETVAAGMAGSGGVLFLRELVWDLKSWRARLKALEGGALQVVMWTAVKGAPASAEGAPAGDEAAPSEGEAELKEALESGELADEDLATTSLPEEGAVPPAEGAEEALGDAAAELDDALFDENA